MALLLLSALGRPRQVSENTRTIPPVLVVNPLYVSTARYTENDRPTVTHRASFGDPTARTSNSDQNTTSQPQLTTWSALLSPITEGRGLPTSLRTSPTRSTTSTTARGTTLASTIDERTRWQTESISSSRSTSRSSIKTQLHINATSQPDVRNYTAASPRMLDTNSSSTHALYGLPSQHVTVTVDIQKTPAETTNAPTDANDTASQTTTVSGESTLFKNENISLTTIWITRERNSTRSRSFSGTTQITRHRMMTLPGEELKDPDQVRDAVQRRYELKWRISVIITVIIAALLVVCVPSVLVVVMRRRRKKKR